MSIRQLFFLTSLLLAAQVPAQAQVAAPPALSLQQALQAARSNLDVNLGLHALSSARADILSANRAPLPILSAKLGQMDLQNGIGEGHWLTEKRVDKSIGLDWTWERGNKRELRTRSAEQAAAAAQAELEDLRTQQQIVALLGFYDLLAAQERLQEISQIERSAAELAASASKRLAAGDLSAQDTARIEIEAQRARTDTRQAELERQRAALGLWQTTGLADIAAQQLRAQADWPVAAETTAPEADMDRLLAARPDVQAAQARVQAAQAAVDGSQALKSADITWGASYDHYPGTSTALVELRMQMPLQWGYSYQGEIARSLAQLALAQDALEKTRRAARTELQRLQHEARSAAERAGSYEKDILPRARQVAAGAELAYSKGALPLTDLLDARRILRATLIDALTARTEHAKAIGLWQLRTQSNTAASTVH